MWRKIAGLLHGTSCALRSGRVPVSTLKTLIAAAILGSLLLMMSTAAYAQDGGGTSGLGITINPTVQRYTTTKSAMYPFRAQNLNPNDINFKDCSDNIVLEFQLFETGLPTIDTLQIWAGPTDCTQQSARV